MNYKILEKMKLRDEGIKVLPSAYQPNGKVITSFSLPKGVMKKYHSLVADIECHEFIAELITKLELEKVKVTETIYSTDFVEYLIRNKVKLVTKVKHEDYRFTSVSLPLKAFNELNKIAQYYGVSRSSILRILIEKHFDSIKR